MLVKEMIELIRHQPLDAEILIGLTEKIKGSGFVHAEEDGEELASDCDGVSQYSSVGKKTIVLRPHLSRIKKV